MSSMFRSGMSGGGGVACSTSKAANGPTKASKAARPSSRGTRARGHGPRAPGLR